MKTTVRFSLIASLALTSFAGGQGAALKPTNESLKNEIERAVRRGIAYLNSQQNESGMWGEDEVPAITGLAVQAILGDPAGAGPIPANVKKALDHIRSKVALDGGIYGKGLGSYNTAICIMALLEADDEKDLPIILRARKFLVNQQSDYDKKGATDNAFDGGVGYGSSYSHPDLSNTYHALEALHYTRNLLKESPEEMIELDWEAAISFVENCQQVPKNKGEWVSRDKEDEGGFVYFPGKSMSEEEVADGRKALRSYGSMSYAGLLSFIYAEMDKDDPRINSVLSWLRKNYSINENPGMGQQGLFYYYNTMSKGLDLLGKDVFELADGKKVNWREDLTKKLFDLQKPDGSWVNDNGRWWEGDPVLSTCYALLCLERIHGGL